MCGLFGMMGYGVNKDDLQVLYELGLTAQVRGTDSSGLFEINSRIGASTQILHKSAHDWSYFSWYHMDSDNATKNPKTRILDSIYQDLFIGHTRSATIGLVNNENAQPFEHGNIVAVHNGTMKDKEYLVGGEERSDSDFFIEDISVRGLSAVVNDVDENSHFAVIVYDKNTKEVHFARNIYRPLWFSVNKKRNVLYWASEGRQLAWILSRNGIEHENLFSLKDGVIWTTKPERIKPSAIMFHEHSTFYTWTDKGKMIWERDNKPLPEPKHKTKEVKNNVVPFDPKATLPKKKQRGMDLSTSCGQCGRTLSVMEQYFIRNGEKGHFDHNSERYHCECVGNVEKQKTMIH